MSQAFISVEGLTSGSDVVARELTVFEDLWFTVEEGEFACMIGHSGAASPHPQRPGGPRYADRRQHHRRRASTSSVRVSTAP